jgi:hypothetical protein
VTFVDASDADAAAAKDLLMEIQPALVERLGIAPEIMALAEAGLE